MQWGLILAVALGGAVGSVARHYLSSTIYGVTGPGINWGILIVNVLGGLIMGLVIEFGVHKFNYSLEVRALLTTGILGGFTTFSTFSLDSALLIEKGDWASVLFYIITSVVLSIGALFAGMWLVRAL